jgi:hypothetical protein
MDGGWSMRIARTTDVERPTLSQARRPRVPDSRSDGLVSKHVDSRASRASAQIDRHASMFGKISAVT